MISKLVYLCVILLLLLVYFLNNLIRFSNRKLHNCHLGMVIHTI